MINISGKENCCGCNACVQKCPKNCITMQEDEEGFLYPFVNKNRCVNCHLCEKVCPVINQGHKKSPVRCFAIKNKDENVRQDSSSGGIFSLLAEYVLSQGGIVFGATFNKKWKVIHSHADNILDYTKFRGSKYVQSDIGNSFIEAEYFLKKGQMVLFSGTPCQISALKLYLGREYDNLLCLDFVCHGVPSPGIFRWYLQDIINRQTSRTPYKLVSLQRVHSIPKGHVIIPPEIKIEDIRFRTKKEGWKKFCFVLRLTKSMAGGSNKTILLSSNVDNNSFLKGFNLDLYLRPSCYNCPCKHFKSGSDITMADFWGQEFTFPEFDDDKGVSAVFPNTRKGNYSIKSIIENSDFIERPFNEFLLYNPSVYYSCQMKKERIKYWKLPYKYSFERRIYKACQYPLRERTINKIKHIFHL